MVEIRELVTTGNILTIITGIGSVITACIILYFKLKTVWTEQQLKHLQQVQELLNAQTKQIETCVHRTPGHPENRPSTFRTRKTD